MNNIPCSLLSRCITILIRSTYKKKGDKKCHEVNNQHSFLLNDKCVQRWSNAYMQSMLMCVVCESVSSLSYSLCISFDEQSQYCQWKRRNRCGKKKRRCLYDEVRQNNRAEWVSVSSRFCFQRVSCLLKMFVAQRQYFPISFNHDAGVITSCSHSM